ncbi:hypothetical protein [Parasitella parasitica]|uniref:SEC7 domain-containing protein n=1 Tax=Parasitella parasitica TaxID=35722 RepID=A0A0B7NPY8_9FUNG|nr:hypothetical protein [Parasitella parasitica]
MLPNSRIIPPNINNNNSTNKDSRGRSNSAMNDSSIKKGFMSRLLTSPTGNHNNSYKEYNVNRRPKYDSVSSSQAKENHATWGSIRIHSPDQKVKKFNNIVFIAGDSMISPFEQSMKAAGSFGKLFKKKAKVHKPSKKLKFLYNFINKIGETINQTNDDIEAMFEDNQPKVRAIHSNVRMHTKIPLAPPPNYTSTRAISRPDQQHFLTNLPDQYIAKRPGTTLTPALPHAADIQPQQPLTEHVSIDPKTPEKSVLKKRSSSALSSGSYSIYSTFGGNESEFSIEEIKVGSVTPPVPASVITTNTNDSKRWENPRNSPAGDSENSFTTVLEEQFEDDDDVNSETITEDGSETTDDEFVDASGFSQEDIERERKMALEKNLAKRLSGGHFGSAGGLVLSINQSSEEFGPPPPLPAAAKHKSQKIPADDELAQSLLKWKCHMDNSKRWSMRYSSSTSTNATTTVMEDTGEKHSSTITVIDMRSAANNTPHHITSDSITINGDHEELSAPDKLALRKEAEEALIGANTPPATKTTYTKGADGSSRIPKPYAARTSLPSISKLTPLKALSTSDTPAATTKPERYSSSEFSKALDAAWKTSDDTWLLFDDDRTKKLKTTIQIQIADHDSNTNADNQVQETARALWNEDEAVVVKERMAEWLGQGKPFEAAVLEAYMQFFVFSEMQLDSAFRKLCSKLYFKAEAQQIDRILESFANRYWECNPASLFGSADVVYAVVYSLLLLNTDLHVAQGNHARMTRSEFIRNTMSTIRDQRGLEDLMGREKRSTEANRAWESNLEHTLKEMYTSVKNYQILQPLSRKSSTNKRGSLLGNSRVIGLKRSVNSIIRKSGRESMLAIDGHDSLSPPRSSTSSSYNRPITPSIKSPRRESCSSTNSSAASFSSRCGSPTLIPQQQQQHLQQPMMQYLASPTASSLFPSRLPFCKEGIVMRKHLLENANHKARHREWRECYLEVHEGELRMYSLQSGQNQLGDKNLFRHSNATPSFNSLDAHSSNSINRLSSRPSSPVPFAGVLANTSIHSKWSSHSQLVGKITLNHTLSNPLPPPGYNRHRPHVFAIQQSDGGVYLFQVPSAEEALEWVSTCNYWAARESKEPLPGGVGNMEYGWGACLNDVVVDLDTVRNGYDLKVNYSSTQDPDSIVINDWMPPTATMVSSQLDEKAQYDALQKHLAELNEEINQHRDIKNKILIKFPTKCNNYPKVISNWEARSKYLLHDIIKYQNYCDSLEKSIKLQQDFIKEQDIASKHDFLEEVIGVRGLEIQGNSSIPKIKS